MTYVTVITRTYVMSKRHQYGIDFTSRIRRIQELIMSRSGIDEFYEIIRLILAKFFSETDGYDRLPPYEICNIHLRSHADAISDILDGILELQTPTEIFSEIQSIFGQTSIHGQDFVALDQAFEQLTARAYKSDKGQYFTPRHVVDMCVEAVDPKPSETVCDPACGSGAFLKSAYSYSLLTHGKAPLTFGFDYSHRACQVAKLVSLIAAEGKIVINQLDSLVRPAPSLLNEPQRTIEDAVNIADFPGFDVIVTNPPFAGHIGAEPYAAEYDLASIYGKRLERDVLFVERCVNLLKDGGRLAIVLPDNKVSSRTFRHVRLWLSKHTRICAVLSLHRYTFLPYTSQKAAVIFAVKHPYRNRSYDSPILFLRSDKPGKSSNGSLLYKAGTGDSLPLYTALDHDLAQAAPLIRSALCEK